MNRAQHSGFIHVPIDEKQKEARIALDAAGVRAGAKEVKADVE